MEAVEEGMVPVFVVVIPGQVNYLRSFTVADWSPLRSPDDDKRARTHVWLAAATKSMAWEEMHDGGG